MAEPDKKSYYCSICKKYHEIVLKKELLKNRESFPFSHIFLHKMELSADIDDIGADILTTLFIDANLAIRGAEVRKLATTDIIAKDDFTNILSQIMEEMGRLQDSLNKLQHENKALKEENELLKRKAGK
nr:hypothetical protein [Candidatus Sigynarchaeota archaeon]